MYKIFIVKVDNIGTCFETGIKKLIKVD